MASKTYIQHFADGTSKLLRRKKQGAPNKPDEMKNECTVIIHMTKAEYQQFVDAQEKSYLKKSAFGRLVLQIGICNYLNQING